MNADFDMRCLAVARPVDGGGEQAENANVLGEMIPDYARGHGHLTKAQVLRDARLRRELPGCSISVAALPEAIEPLRRQGFVVDPGGIRAMGLQL